MPCAVWRHRNSILLELDSKVYHFDFGDRGIDVILGEALFLFSDFKKIIEKVLIDSFGGFGHVYFFGVFGFREVERKSSTVIDVSMRD